MRQLKFRAWHAGHEWAEPQMLYDEKPGDCLVWKNQGQNITQVMQYTGVKAVDEVETYEGDVLLNKTNGNTYLVLYDEHSFYYQSIYDSWTKKNIFNNKKRTWLSQSYVKYLQVIGNIYENPELLEV